MYRIIVTASLLSSLFITCLGSGGGWSYTGEKGTDHWKVDNHHCGGSSQSPIDIKYPEYDTSLTSFNLASYAATARKLVFKNNGHAAQVDVTGDYVVSGGGLPDSYKVAQFHFHWGSDESKGSEHFLNGHSFPMEMHIVHYSTKYNSLGEAADKDKGLAVFGIFFEVSSFENPAYNFLAKYAKDIRYGNKTVDIQTFALKDLLPKDMGVYYRYQGSLTTPPCYESVVWTVFRTGVKISQTQLLSLRSLLHSDGGHSFSNLVNNFRPVQPLNSRGIYTSDIMAGVRAGASSNMRSRFAALLLVAVTYLI